VGRRTLSPKPHIRARMGSWMTSKDKTCGANVSDTKRGANLWGRGRADRQCQGAQSGVSGLRDAMVSPRPQWGNHKRGLGLGDPQISFPIDEGFIGSKGFELMRMGSHFQRIWRTLNRTHGVVQAVPPDREPDLAVPFGSVQSEP
jgi:hypothetical protein